MADEEAKMPLENMTILDKGKQGERELVTYFDKDYKYL